MSQNNTLPDQRAAPETGTELHRQLTQQDQVNVAESEKSMPTSIAPVTSYAKTEFKSTSDEHEGMTSENSNISSTGRMSDDDSKTANDIQRPYVNVKAEPDSNNNYHGARDESRYNNVLQLNRAQTFKSEPNHPNQPYNRHHEQYSPTSLASDHSSGSTSGGVVVSNVSENEKLRGIYDHQQHHAEYHMHQPGFQHHASRNFEQVSNLTPSVITATHNGNHSQSDDHGVQHQHNWQQQETPVANNVTSHQPHSVTNTSAHQSWPHNNTFIDSVLSNPAHALVSGLPSNQMKSNQQLLRGHLTNVNNTNNSHNLNAHNHSLPVTANGYHIDWSQGSNSLANEAMHQHHSIYSQSGNTSMIYHPCDGGKNLESFCFLPLP